MTQEYYKAVPVKVYKKTEIYLPLAIQPFISPSFIVSTHSNNMQVVSVKKCGGKVHVMKRQWKTMN